MLELEVVDKAVDLVWSLEVEVQWLHSGANSTQTSGDS